jgi:hypothetical protein
MVPAFDRQIVHISLMEFPMKRFIFTFVATLTLAGRTVLAAEPPIVASEAAVRCVPGMVVVAAPVCSLPGFHWKHTIVYVGRHDYTRVGWVLLPNK